MIEDVRVGHDDEPPVIDKGNEGDRTCNRDHHDMMYGMIEMRMSEKYEMSGAEKNVGNKSQNDCNIVSLGNSYGYDSGGQVKENETYHRNRNNPLQNT